MQIFQIFNSLSRVCKLLNQLSVVLVVFKQIVCNHFAFFYSSFCCFTLFVSLNRYNSNNSFIFGKCIRFILLNNDFIVCILFICLFFLCFKLNSLVVFHVAVSMD